MQMMHKLDKHPSCDKIKAHADLCSENEVDLIAINQLQICENGKDADFRIP
jgi:hypothetical protein